MNVVNVVNVFPSPQGKWVENAVGGGGEETFTTFSDVHSIALLEAKRSGRESTQ